MSGSINAAVQGDHLCVLVHGLWGNPTHMEYISIALTSAYPSVHLLMCERNSGTFTYDGIETGGERIAKEIEEALEGYDKRGVKIRKLSIVGYSLGGLVSRYAIGLLYSRGWFNKVKPVNFTTFATPHLGVRTPLLGWHNHIWNVIGARVLSVSGRQLFLIDDFRKTGRPLLSILADKDSVFYKGLACFPNKILYANIVNDRSTCFYTSAISRIDPFEDLSAVEVNFAAGYEPIVVDPAHPVSPSLKQCGQMPFTDLITQTTSSGAKRLPRFLGYLVFVPVFVMAFLLNALFQTINSKRRIRLHNTKGAEKDGYYYYRELPLLLVEEMQEAVESVIEDIHQMQEPEHLPAGPQENAYFGEARLRNVMSAPGSLRSMGHGCDKVLSLHKTTSDVLLPYNSQLRCMTDCVSPHGSESLCDSPKSQFTFAERSAPMPPTDLLPRSVKTSGITSPAHTKGSNDSTESAQSEIPSGFSVSISRNSIKPQDVNMEFPTLALALTQFAMIENLDKLMFRKFPVWIHKDVHAHAAIIVRKPWDKRWEEGKVVIRHWLREGFWA